MTDRDRLIDDINDWGMVSGTEALADRLIALGWTRLDEGGLRRALGAAYDALLIDAPGDDEHRWCDEDSEGNHRLDSELWLRDAAAAIAKAYREDTDAHD